MLCVGELSGTRIYKRCPLFRPGRMTTSARSVYRTRRLAHAQMPIFANANAIAHVNANGDVNVGAPAAHGNFNASETQLYSTRES